MSREKNKVAIVALVLLAIVTGCVIGSSEADTKGVSGTVNIAGSSALLPLAQTAAKTFMDKNPDSVINTNGGGSGQGLPGARVPRRSLPRCRQCGPAWKASQSAERRSQDSDPGRKP